MPSAYYFFNPHITDVSGKVGGAQTQTYIMSTELAKRNFNVHFCVADFGQSELETIKQVKLWKISNRKDTKIIQALSLFKILKKIKADLYIFRSADAGVAIAISYLKFFRKKKVAYMIAHDMETTRSNLRKQSGLLTSIAMQLVYKYADIITAQTQQQSALFEKNKKRKPDSIIKNVFPIKEEIKKVEAKKNTILWVGRLNKIKNAQLFLELAKKNKSENFIMIAPLARNQDDYGNKIKNIAKTIDNLELIDYVPHNEIYKYYNQAKVYVITSDSEGFSNTMAEAMAAKCAIYSYKVNNDNIINNYNMGYCADGNISKFNNSFSKLLNNDGLEKYGQNAYEYLLKNHNIEKNLNILISLINGA